MATLAAAVYFHLALFVPVSPHARQEGWTLLSASSDVFRCYSEEWDARYHGDLGASLAVLDRGWNLGSMMLKYAGVDWRDEANWGCNQRWEGMRLRVALCFVLPPPVGLQRRR
jgi:hypothetical protein